MFSGFSQNQAPFVQSSGGIVTYTGTTDYQNVLVNEGRPMEIGMPGSDVFGNVQYVDQMTGNTSSIALFATLGAMHQALMDNDTGAITDNLDRISSAHNHLIIQQAIASKARQSAPNSLNHIQTIALRLQ